jgi:hypothetical protein
VRRSPLGWGLAAGTVAAAAYCLGPCVPGVLPGRGLQAVQASLASGAFERRTGRPLPPPGDRARGAVGAAVYDAWGHCALGCCVTKRCGGAVAAGTATAYEAIHEALRRVSGGLVEHDSLLQDLQNEAVGRGYGRRRAADCGTACATAAVAGELDLSLADPAATGRPAPLVGAPPGGTLGWPL